VSGARVFDHLDFRVGDVARAKPFYDAMLRLFGMRGRVQPDGSVVYLRISDGKIEEAFALLEDRAHRPNATRVAFGAPSSVEVDRIAAALRGANAQRCEGPELCPEIAPDYYAFFFEDVEGNRFEVVAR
jgi:catechol 2,3-dioxygenase-like lactoylglutathione lyase family enzyme